MPNHHRRWPWITRYGVHFVHSPADHRQYRIDPNGEAKAVERHAAAQRLCSQGEAGQRLMLELPPHQNIYLQVLDTSAGWVNRTLCIDTGKMRFLHGTEDTYHFAGDPHRRRKASHLSHVLIPFVVAMAPYMAYSTWRHEREEAEEGMSRFGIDLLRKIKGQLDPVVEGILHKALMSEWKRKFKLERAVDFFQACAVLDACDVTIHRKPPIPGDAYASVEMVSYGWVDREGDLVGSIAFAGTEPFAARVLGTLFVPEDAEERKAQEPTRIPLLLTAHFRNRFEESENVRVQASGSL